jgi:2-C-methyl-D-erythritol 4-phosphate cytidylyltransferase
VDLTAVHDAARPLVSSELILKSFDIAEKQGNAVPAVNVNESVRILDTGYFKRINRENLK